jgi:hypothetical protein
MVEKLREKLSGRRQQPHLRHRLRARRQARSVLRRRGLVFLSLRRLASTEEALPPSRAASTAWVCASFARKRFPAAWRRTKSFKRAASTARCCWTSEPRRSQFVSYNSHSHRRISGEQRPLALARNLVPPAVPNNNYEEETVAHTQPFYTQVAFCSNYSRCARVGFVYFYHPVWLSSAGQ